MIELTSYLVYSFAYETVRMIPFIATPKLHSAIGFRTIHLVSTRSFSKNVRVRILG